MKPLKENQLDKLIQDIVKTYRQKELGPIESLNLPNVSVIYGVLDDLFKIIFPGYMCEEVLSKASLTHYVGDQINHVYTRLVPEVEKLFIGQDRDASKVVLEFLKAIPQIRMTLKNDILAADGGDPAAKSFDEIILSYPGLYAIVVYRVAHELFNQNVPLIPRIMTERAHSLTGIDIHPGAEIGSHFFIDHGTGVVIGETCLIGSHVKLYQGVTLGALSFPKDADGKVLKGQKRHPTIEDGVTIYANATILGPITIGKNCVLGGNVWITDSVPKDTVVTIAAPDHEFRKKTGSKEGLR